MLRENPNGDVCSFGSSQDAVKIMAKDLVRTRRYVKKFIMMKANIQAVSLKIQTLKSNNSMAQAMKGVTKAMATMNRQVCQRTTEIHCLMEINNKPPVLTIFCLIHFHS